MITQLSSPGASLKTYFSQLETGDLVPEDSRFRGLCGPGLGVEIDGSFVTGVSHVPLHQLRQTPCPPCPRLQQLWLKIHWLETGTGDLHPSLGSQDSLIQLLRVGGGMRSPREEGQLLPREALPTFTV